MLTSPNFSDLSTNAMNISRSNSNDQRAARLSYPKPRYVSDVLQRPESLAALLEMSGFVSIR